MFFSEDDILEMQRREREDDERAYASKPDFIEPAACNLCLRPVGPDGSMGLCGGCRRQETPESQA